ncbi:CHRNA7-FAM7A fusion protein-like [Watersipora subatra]|uniref:CHRNA7-FAM7A fusion protein-like n=1 Tax=Watersipora subatra TaxID=2589382 RepID=UPI00355BB4C7
MKARYTWIPWLLGIIYSCWMTLTVVSGAHRSNVDTTLLKDIMEGYDSRVIARVDDNPLVVRVGFTLVQLHHLDEKKQMLTSSGWFQVDWVDDRLNASIYHTSMIKNEFRCVVYSDGSVLWVPGGTYHTTCELDISKFPFDKQTCYLHLTNWAYNIAEMNLVRYSEKIVLDSYNPSAEWNLTDTSVIRDEIVYECCGNISYPSLHFRIWIERRSLYYIVNIITPCIILSLLATFTFCIPPDSGEKISLGITLLLSFTVFQLIVAESIPRRSDSIPIISLYISVITGVVTSSIICTILISQIHHRGEATIPYRLRRFTFDFLAPIVFLGELKHMHGTHNHIPERQAKTPNVWSSRLCPSSSVARLKLVNGGYPISHEIPHKEDANCECKACYQCCMENSPQENTNSGKALHGKVLSSIDRHLEQIIEALSEYENRRVESTSSEFRIAEWKAVGKVYDRFFFVVFVVTMLVITIIFLWKSEVDTPTLGELKVATGRPTPTIT